MAALRDAGESTVDEPVGPPEACAFELTDDREGALGRAAGAFGVPVDEVRDHPLVLVGTVDHVVEQLEEQRESLGVNLRTVPHHFVEAFAPVVARLRGR